MFNDDNRTGMNKVILVCLVVAVFGAVDAQRRRSRSSTSTRASTTTKARASTTTQAPSYYCAAAAAYYNPYEKICCSSGVLADMPDTVPMDQRLNGFMPRANCCGNVGYDSSYLRCCAGSKLQTERCPTLCAGVEYNMTTAMCCSNTLHQLNGAVASQYYCCGTIMFKLSENSCCVDSDDSSIFGLIPKYSSSPDVLTGCCSITAFNMYNSSCCVVNGVKTVVAGTSC